MDSKTISCFVFDLDDTLYSERHYQISGFRAVAEYCSFVYRKDLFELMLRWEQQGHSDIFALLCTELGIPSRCKYSFIWVYRNHFPSIALSPQASKAVNEIQEGGHAVAILTDGRSATQRQKINALGLSHVPVYISEEWHDTKPGRVRFEAIQRELLADNYWYVGDNPKKDFFAPKQLGWKTVGLRGNECNVHSQDTDGLASDCLPAFWISNLSELLVNI